MTVEHVASPQEMRRVLGSFATGVTVVTGTAGGLPVGFACQSFASVSLDPPLVLFCPAHTSRSWPLIRESGSFCVNVLADDQEDLCARFATTGADKFADLAWHQTPWGPSLDGVLSTVMCEIQDVHAAGDHDIVVGRVRELVLHRDDAAPLVFYRGTFGLEL